MTQAGELVLSDLLKLAGDHARTVLVKAKQPSLMPTWLLLNQSANVMMVGTPWEDDDDKARARKLMRAHMRKLGVIAYSFVTEAWAATVEPHEVDAERKTLFDPMRGPVHRADREEIVLACAATPTQIKWRQWRIVREPTTERIVDLKAKPSSESEHSPEGWLVEMLK